MQFNTKADALELFVAVRPRLETILIDAVETVGGRDFEDKSDFYASVFEAAAQRIRQHSATVKNTTL